MIEGWVLSKQVVLMRMSYHGNINHLIYTWCWEKKVSGFALELAENQMGFLI